MTEAGKRMKVGPIWEGRGPEERGRPLRMREMVRPMAQLSCYKACSVG